MFQSDARLLTNNGDYDVYQAVPNAFKRYMRKSVDIRLNLTYFNVKYESYIKGLNADEICNQVSNVMESLHIKELQENEFYYVLVNISGRAYICDSKAEVQNLINWHFTRYRFTF